MKNTMTIKVDGATHARGDGAKATLLTLLVLLLTLGTVAAESASPSNALAQSPGRPVAQSLVQAVDSVGFTVSDVDASVEFFSKVLSFEKVSETEVTGAEYEHLQGVFGRSEERRVGKECGYRWWPYH